MSSDERHLFGGGRSPLGGSMPHGESFDSNVVAAGFVRIETCGTDVDFG
ncbi:hypothetical protein ES703_67331 [subsurface metagenome]